MVNDKKTFGKTATFHWWTFVVLGIEFLVLAVPFVLSLPHTFLLWIFDRLNTALCLPGTEEDCD